MAKRQLLWCAVACALTMAACSHGSSLARKGSTGGQSLAEWDLGEVKAAFARVAARYSAAKARGALAQKDCDELAQAFLTLYRTYGHPMAVAKFNAAAVREECGDIDQAVELYESLVREEPKYALAYNNLGAIHLRRGNENLALELFTRAVEADSMITAPRNNLAAALRDKYKSRPEQADFTRAELEAQRVLALDSNNRIAYENLARLYYDRGRLHDKSYLLLAQLVITQAQARAKAGTLEPSAEVHNLHGLLLIEQGNPTTALRAFKRAVEIDTKHTDAHLNIALVAIRFRDYPTAEHSLEVALADRRQRTNVDAYLGLGVAQRGLRKYAAAQKSFEHAIAVGANDPRAHYNLGILYQEHIGPASDRKSGFDKRPYEKAKAHFETFVARAKDRSLDRAKADATVRIAGIDRFFIDIAEMEELERKSRELEDLARKQAEEEKQRLLELERKIGSGAAPL